MNVTRDVVVDLLPLYSAGEASADTRRLVEEFLQSDPELARAVRDDASAELLAPVSLTFRPDHEMKTLVKVRRALHRKDWPFFFALLFTALAFGRIVSDTSWDVSPRRFIVTAAIAGAFWIFFFVRYARRLAALR